jgi:hypothetical protein
LLCRLLHELEAIAGWILKRGQPTAPVLKFRRTCELNAFRSKLQMLGLDVFHWKAESGEPTDQLLIVCVRVASNNLNDELGAAGIEHAKAMFLIEDLHGQPQSISVEALGLANVSNEYAYGPKLHTSSFRFLTAEQIFDQIVVTQTTTLTGSLPLDGGGLGWG